MPDNPPNLISTNNVGTRLRGHVVAQFNYKPLYQKIYFDLPVKKLFLDLRGLDSLPVER